MMTSYLGSLAYKSWKLTKIMPNSLKLLNHYILSNAPHKIRQWALIARTGSLLEWILFEVCPFLVAVFCRFLFQAKLACFNEIYQTVNDLVPRDKVE